ncbi:MAG: hypothetical protein IPN71_06220 [Fibrobacteres bacterium]|nr:hypothetical protein [Fibrobacterota bacterium]
MSNRWTDRIRHFWIHRIFKRKLLVLGFLLGIGAVCGYLFLAHRSGTQDGVPAEVVSDTTQPAIPREPLFIDAWVKDVLESNGYSPLASRKYMTETDGRVTVDFRSLVIWTLPAENYTYGEKRFFPDSLRIDAGGLCGELPLEVASWLDKALPSWRSAQQCAPSDIEARLDRWLAENLGRFRSSGRVKDPMGRVVSLSLVCTDAAEEFDPRRLKVDGHLRRLELTGCRLSHAVSEGRVVSTFARGLSPLPLRALVLRQVRSPYLDLRVMKTLDTLDVEEGDLSVLAMTIEKRSIPGVRLAKVPLCDAEVVSRLRSSGAQIEELTCPEAASKLLAMASAVQTDLDQVTSVIGSMIVDTTGEQMYGEIIRDTILSPPIWEGFTLRHGYCEGKSDTAADPLEVGDGWIQIPGQGAFYFGDMSAISGGRFRRGATQEEVERNSTTRAFARSANFLIWADDEDGLRLILHFREKQLDAVWVPDGCWTAGWVAARRESYRVHLISE